MKKFLSFALALAMTATLVPATAFASSDLKVNKVITAEVDDDFYNGSGDTKEAPVLTLKANSNFKETTQEFEVKLENAEWYEDTHGNALIDGYTGHVMADGDSAAAPQSLIDERDAAEDAKDAAQATVDALTATGDAKAYADAQALVTSTKATLETATTEEATAKEELATATTTKEQKDTLLAEAQDALDKVAAEKASTKYTESAGATAPNNFAGVAMTAAPTKTDVAGGNYIYYTVEGTEGGTAIADGTAVTADQFLATTFATDLAAWNAYEEASAYAADVDARLATAGTELSAAQTAANDAETAVNTKQTAYNTKKGDLETAQKNYDDAVAALAKLTAPAELEAAVKALDEATEKYNKLAAEVAGYTGTGSSIDATFEVSSKSASTIIVTVKGAHALPDDAEFDIPLWVTVTGGTATVSVDGKNSEFTSETKTFAKTVDGATVFTTEGVKNFYDNEELKDFFVEELTPGTFEDGKEITVSVSNGFEFDDKKGKVEVISGNATIDSTIIWDDDKDEFKVKVTGESTRISQIKFSGFELEEDGADYGDVAELTINGAGVSKETIEVGTYSDFGITMEAEDKELPVIYAGTKADNENENQTLKVVIEETVAGSFIADRKVELKLPEGVEFSDKNEGIDDSSKSFKISNFEVSKKTVQDAFDCNEDGDKITIDEMPGAQKDKKRKIEVVFNISAAADFTGDVDLTLTGPGVGNEEITTTVATVKAPIEVKADVNELKLDYRNTEASDITLVEPAAGVWADGDKITVEVEEMHFESGIKAEVVSGDMKLKKLDGDNVDVDKKKGTITIEVDKESNKEPAEIKISGVSLYMERNLPAGDYELTVKGDVKNETFMNNYDEDKDDKDANYFDVEDITVLEDYVKVVTAGRDQDDATFTTKITVPVGADKIMAGTKEIALDAPAYINKDGYTMLPVRAVTEALNGVAAIKWDDATKTATINFGQRVFSMTVNSKVMNINGVQTNLLAAPEIKNERIFLPLRDLGYALGLQDEKINWDSATSTATLN